MYFLIFYGQDRLVKVVFFVFSLLDNVRQPIIITVAPSNLSLWEAEFSKWSKPTIVVTYKGNKDTRAAIRASEFYSETGILRFQFLLSSSDVIVEDMESFDHIKWELIVIDECQHNTISMHSKKVDRLVADMKLLTVTGETVVCFPGQTVFQDSLTQPGQNLPMLPKPVIDSLPIRQDMNCRYILSLLDYKFEDIDIDADMETDDVTHALKERLSPFIAFECKFDTTKFQEFWLPIHLSSMQIEQYCTILDSNMKVLSSCTKRSPSIQNILTQTRKCYDHPYLVDPFLRNSSNRNSSVDPVGAKILASGKLHILYKLLLEIKRSGLRVVVLFQPAESSENISLGDILEDLLHQRFGQDSYVHIQGIAGSRSAHKKREQALKMFNCVKNGNKLHIQTDSKDLSSESAFIDDLLHEFSSLLKASNGKTGPTKGSFISNAQPYDGFYSTSIMLLGEAEAHKKESSSVDDHLIENGPAFWRKNLKESRQRWKNLGSRSSQRVQSHSYLLEGFGTSLFIKTKPRSKRKVVDKSKQRKWGGLPANFGGHQSSDISHAPDQKSMLLSECEKELLEVRKKYDTLIQESGTSLRNQLKNLVLERNRLRDQS